MSEKKIIIASDHAGYELKNKLMQHFEKQGIKFTDIGCYNKESCDYPIIAKNAAKAITEKKAENHIIIYKARRFLPERN